MNLQFHPGLNVCKKVITFKRSNDNSNEFQVGMGKNGTLFALKEGRVVVTADQFNPNWDHTWVQRIYAGREDQTIFKKYFNVIPFEQHNRFKLIDQI